MSETSVRAVRLPKPPSVGKREKENIMFSRVPNTKSRREKKNIIFSRVLNVKSRITVAGRIASPLVEKKKKIEFFSRFPIQNLLYPISLIRLKINKYVIIHRKI